MMYRTRVLLATCIVGTCLGKANAWSPYAVSLTIPHPLIAADGGCSTTARAQVLLYASDRTVHQVANAPVTFMSTPGSGVVFDGTNPVCTDSAGYARIQIRGMSSGVFAVTAVAYANTSNQASSSPVSVTLSSGHFDYGAHVTHYTIDNGGGGSLNVFGDYFDAESDVAFLPLLDAYKEITVDIGVKAYATWAPDDAASTPIPPGWKYRYRAYASCDSGPYAVHPRPGGPDPTPQDASGWASATSNQLAPTLTVSCGDATSETWMSGPYQDLTGSIPDSTTATDYTVTIQALMKVTDDHLAAKSRAQCWPAYLDVVHECVALGD